jgi:uncharacterized protein (TIGR00369 family)
MLARWASGQGLSGGGEPGLPPHHSSCLGCGPDNPHGHHLQVRRENDGVAAEHRFDERHVGAPGIAHGGAVATVIDDLYGFLLYVVGELAVTRSLQIEYLAPVRLGVDYGLRAELERREGRKLYVRAQIVDQRDRLAVSSTAVFITVNIDHFLTPPKIR